jgi:hypothetical protein
MSEEGKSLKLLAPQAIAIRLDLAEAEPQWWMMRHDVGVPRREVELWPEGRGQGESGINESRFNG